MQILIIGAGGHGQVVADIFACMRETLPDLQVAGYLDDAADLHGKVLGGIPVLGPLSRLSEIPHDAVILAIGDNRIRAMLFDHLRNTEEHFITARHPKSVIAANVDIGLGCMICAGVIVNTGAKVGDNVILNTGCTVDHHNHVESHVHVAPGAHLGGDVAVGEGVLIGLGAGVMPRCKIGRWTVVGAGAIVHRNLPDSITVAGVPARVVRRAKE
jgi:sugar O-acyltransferase (sialic acid O-acetyltransferase NeuD family)